MRGKDVIASDIVLSVELEHKISIYGFQPETKRSQVLKISVLLPRFIATSRRILEGGFSWTGNKTQLDGYKTYETNIDFEIRYDWATATKLTIELHLLSSFMADLNIVGCNWIEIPAGKYSVRSLGTRGNGQHLRIQSRYVSQHRTGHSSLPLLDAKSNWMRGRTISSRIRPMANGNVLLPCVS